MLLSKLAKAKNNSQNLSPSSSQYSSGSKRTTLDIFSNIRRAEELAEKARAPEDEIEAMLD